MKMDQADDEYQADTVSRTLSSTVSFVACFAARFIAWAWESCGLWLVSLMMGLIVVQILLSAGYDATRQAWQDDRVSMILGELAGQLETDLSVGIDPTVNGQAQRAISDVYARHPVLYRTALVNTEGRVVADSDRANIGTYMPAFLITAALSSHYASSTQTARDRAGRTWAMDQRLHGVVVRNAYGVTVGYVLAGLPTREVDVGGGPGTSDAAWRVAGFWCLTAFCVFCTAWALALFMLRREGRREERMVTLAYDEAMQGADARLARLDAALISLRHHADMP